MARSAHQLHRLCSQKVSQHNSFSFTDKLEHKLWTDAYCHSLSILKSLVFRVTDPWSLMMIHIFASQLGLILGCLVALFLCCMVECATPFRPIKPYALSGLIVSRSPLSPILVRIPLTKLPQSRHLLQIVLHRLFAHLSRPWSIGWVALSFLFVCLFVRPSRYGNIWPNLHFYFP